MTLAADADANRAALVAQLHDKWHGRYIVQRIEAGVYVDVRPLGRDEAIAYRLRSGAALRLEWNQ